MGRELWLEKEKRAERRLIPMKKGQKDPAPLQIS